MMNSSSLPAAILKPVAGSRRGIKTRERVRGFRVDVLSRMTLLEALGVTSRSRGRGNSDIRRNLGTGAPRKQCPRG